MIDRMRWMVDNRDEAREFGRNAAAVVTRRTVDDLGHDLARELVGGEHGRQADRIQNVA